jgi:hypothetical protein|tara:strand:+ start:9607 stop:10263 length:657 start_codon:yes stop_codon:yes gene_type:complete
MGIINEEINRNKTLMGIITEQYSGIIKRGDVPCDIWCKRKSAQEGSRGDVVKMIQNLLSSGCGDIGPYNAEKLGGGINEGCIENWTDCDGKFGPETEKAVKEFQEDVGKLEVDGKVGWNTLNSLCGYCYGSGSFKDSAAYSLCQKECDCEQQGTDGIQDVIDNIGDVDIDDWSEVIVESEGDNWNNCERIKACLYYTSRKNKEYWHDFLECMAGKFYT